MNDSDRVREILRDDPRFGVSSMYEIDRSSQARGTTGWFYARRPYRWWRVAYRWPTSLLLLVYVIVLLVLLLGCADASLECRVAASRGPTLFSRSGCYVLVAGRWVPLPRDTEQSRAGS